MPGRGFKGVSIREAILEQVERFRREDPCSSYTTTADAVQGLLREALAVHADRHRERPKP